MSFGLFQPKWQVNDYYMNNFRINKGDSVQMHYCANNAVVCSAGTEVTISAGAYSLAASAIALGALSLAF